MACGVMGFALTFGVLVRVSAYSLRLFAFVLGTLFGGSLVGFGALVDFAVNESEEFGKVGCRPARNSFCETARNHCSGFTSSVR